MLFDGCQKWAVVESGEVSKSGLTQDIQEIEAALFV